MEANPTPRDIPRQRAIIDRRSLTDTLVEIGRDQDTSTDAKRSQVRDILKDALAKGRTEIRERFGAGHADEDARVGMLAVRSMAFLIDQLVRVVHDYADWYAYPSSNPTTAERLA